MRTRIGIIGLLGAAACLVSGLAVGGGESPEVQATRDLRQTGLEAGERGVPIMLAFVSEDCPYCHLLEDDFLRPMLISGDYDDKVLIRKLNMDYSQVRDFQGRRLSTHEFADRYSVTVTPTIVYVDSSGEELAPTTVGVRTPSLFGGYLDRAIDTALEEYRGRDDKPGMVAGDCDPAPILC